MEDKFIEIDMFEDRDSKEIEKAQEKKNLRSPSLFLNQDDNYYKTAKVIFLYFTRFFIFII